MKKSWCVLWAVKYGIWRKKEGRIEETGRWGRRQKHLLDHLKEAREYCKLKEEALDNTLWRTGFGRGYGTVARQIKKCIN